jgi:glutamine amidotransferase
METKVAIIDYGLGNLFSINNACKLVGLNTIITKDIDIINNADALILPGVGAFGDAMNSLNNNNLTQTIYEFVNTGKPFLGICLGMQLLFSESEEFGSNKGLNLINGKVVKFPSINNNRDKIRVPQIQWNQIYAEDKNRWEDSPLRDIPEGSYMHFVHSYFAIPEDKNDILTYTEYEGTRYASAVKKGNIIGIQYHPEKSAKDGIKIYQNWANFIKNKTY